MISSSLRIGKLLPLVTAFSVIVAHALPIDEVKRERNKQAASEQSSSAHQASSAADAKTQTQPPHATPKPAAPLYPAPRIPPPPFAADIEHYVAVFRDNDVKQQIEACRALEFAGLSDARVFDPIQDKLLQIHKAANDGNAVAYATWLARALAYSGQDKYRPALQTVADQGGHGKLRKQASAALKMLDDYRVWTPVIGDTAAYNYDKSSEVNRLANMLRSAVASLQTTAARQMISSDEFDPYLMAVVQQKVTGSLRGPADEAGEDALVWMLKAVAGSHNAIYRDTLQEAANNAGSPRVRKYAAGLLRKFD